MMERDTGRSKALAVEMGSDAEAQAAIASMNGQSLGVRYHCRQKPSMEHVLHVPAFGGRRVAVTAVVAAAVTVQRRLTAAVVIPAVAAAGSGSGGGRGGY
jgi:hypothetical protein